MHKRKRRKKPKALFIPRTVIYYMISAIFLAIVIFIGSKKEFTTYQLNYIVGSEIPMIYNSARLLENTKNNLINFLKSHSVLAETLPMIEFNITNNDLIKKRIPSPTPDKEKELIPENTFPIKNSQTISKNLEIRNETTYAPDINSLLYAPLSFKTPEILIVHTHASESYKTDNLNYYSESESDRTTDIQLNVVRVGEELAKELTNYGFKVTHAKDINDYPSYNQSYNKTLEVINYYLRNNKNIQIVLDIHRDSIVKNDGTKFKFTSTINDENVAQVMLVCGTNQAGLENDTWQENLKFSLKMQNYMETYYPGLARPLNLRQERFNTHATLGSMIIEVGTSGNTLQEALSSTKYLAKTIKEILTPYR